MDYIRKTEPVTNNTGSKPVIFLVEDNQDLLYNLKLVLELNGYDVIIAENGVEALDRLATLASDKLPALIISDIMMPKMDGYEFFREVSKNPLWNLIPFIYLTAKNLPEDIRLGKMLGIDDYIVKPVKEEDLLAIIGGKLARAKKNNLINRKLNSLLSPSLTQQTKAESSDKRSIALLFAVWSDKSGPELQNCFPENLNLPNFSIDELTFQLFSSLSQIYGNLPITEPQSLHLNIENIKRQGYLFFDSIYDESVRHSQRLYMLGVIAPQINYFKSLELKRILSQLSNQIKRGANWDVKTNWEKIVRILMSPIV